MARTAGTKDLSTLVLSASSDVLDAVVGAGELLYVRQIVGGAMNQDNNERRPSYDAQKQRRGAAEEHEDSAAREVNYYNYLDKAVCIQDRQQYAVVEAAAERLFSKTSEDRQTDVGLVEQALHRWCGPCTVRDDCRYIMEGDPLYTGICGGKCISRGKIRDLPPVEFKRPRRSRVLQRSVDGDSATETRDES